MVMIFLENSNIEKVKDKLSQCFLTNLELGIWDLKEIQKQRTSCDEKCLGH